MNLPCFISDVARILYTISNDHDMVAVAKHSWGTESLPRILVALGFDIPSDRDLKLLENTIPSLFSKQLKFFQDDPIRLVGLGIGVEQ
jgi:hypothetical protein